MRTPHELNLLLEQVVMLRREGKSRREIKQTLGPMSNATLNDALKDEPPPEWTRRPNAKDELRASARELRTQGLDYEEIAAALGVAKSSVSKSKAHRPSSRVIFTNSDPGLIQFFMRFLDAAGTPRADLAFRVFIHENADVESAQRFWRDVTGASPGQFLTPALKRHNPRTTRKNVGENYHGCLRIDVRRSAELYHRIEGWAAAGMAARRSQNEHRHPSR